MQRPQDAPRPLPRASWTSPPTPDLLMRCASPLVAPSAPVTELVETDHLDPSDLPRRLRRQSRSKGEPRPVATAQHRHVSVPRLQHSRRQRFAQHQPCYSAEQAARAEIKGPLAYNLPASLLRLVMSRRRSALSLDKSALSLRISFLMPLISFCSCRRRASYFSAALRLPCSMARSSFLRSALRSARSSLSFGF